MSTEAGPSRSSDNMAGTDHEIQAIQGHWKRFKKFLDDLSNLEKMDSDSRVQQEIRSIMVEIDCYVKRHKEALKMPELENVKSEKEELQDTDGEDPSNEDSSAAEDSGDSDMSIRTETSKVSGTKKRKTKKVIKSTSKEGSLIDMISKLDNRKVLDMEEFEEEGHMELSEYFDMFEEYHSENYKGRKYFWLNQLKKYLTGRTLENYRSIRQNEDNYNVVKRKLIKWYNDEKEIRIQRARKRFEREKMKDRESLLSYSNRLLSSFKKAFPNKKPDHSSTLIYKLQKTVPKSVRSKIDTQMAHYKLRDTKMSYERIQKYCGILDLEDSGEETSDRDESIIKINLTRQNPVSNNKWNGKYKDSDFNDKSYANKNLQKNEQRMTNKNESSNHQVQAGKDSMDIPKEESYETCSYCGRFGHKFDRCRKRLGGCFKCGKYGHFAKDCWTNKNSSVKRPNGRQQSISPNKYRGKREYERSRSYNVEARQPREKKPLN